MTNETGAYFTGSGVIGSDLVASNGIVHVIDTVLIPNVPEIEFDFKQMGLDGDIKSGSSIVIEYPMSVEL